MSNGNDSSGSSGSGWLWGLGGLVAGLWYGHSKGKEEGEKEGTHEGVRLGKLEWYGRAADDYDELMEKADIEQDAGNLHEALSLAEEAEGLAQDARRPSHVDGARSMQEDIRYDISERDLEAEEEME